MPGRPDGIAIHRTPSIFMYRLDQPHWRPYLKYVLTVVDGSDAIWAGFFGNFKFRRLKKILNSL